MVGRGRFSHDILFFPTYWLPKSSSSNGQSLASSAPLLQSCLFAHLGVVLSIFYLCNSIRSITSFSWAPAPIFWVGLLNPIFTSCPIFIWNLIGFNRVRLYHSFLLLGGYPPQATSTLNLHLFAGGKLASSLSTSSILGSVPNCTLISRILSSLSGGLLTWIFFSCSILIWFAQPNLICAVDSLRPSRLLVFSSFGTYRSLFQSFLPLSLVCPFQSSSLV